MAITRAQQAKQCYKRWTYWIYKVVPGEVLKDMVESWRRSWKDLKKEIDCKNLQDKRKTRYQLVKINTGDFDQEDENRKNKSSLQIHNFIT